MGNVKIKKKVEIEEEKIIADTEKQRQERRALAKEKATKISVSKLINSETLTAEEVGDVTYLFDEFEVGKAYITGDMLVYNDKLYRVVQGHTSQENWTPDVVTNLFTRVKAPNAIEEWGERDLTVNPFMTGEQVKFEDVVYESTIDNNVWTPTDYPQGWKVGSKQ